MSGAPSQDLQAEDGAMRRRVDQACPDNIPNAAAQDEIVVPLAIRQRADTRNYFDSSGSAWRRSKLSGDLLQASTDFDEKRVGPNTRASAFCDCVRAAVVPPWFLRRL
jgi:hypothetical protein